MEPHREAKGKAHTHIGVSILLLAVLVVVLLAILAYSYLSSSPVTHISSLQLSFSPNTTFSFAGAYYLAYVHSLSGKSSAVIYLERQPVLLNPILAINVSATAGTFVNPTMGSVADMEIRLISATNSSAVISVSYINPSLSIPTSSNDIQVLSYVAAPKPVSNSTATKPSNSSSGTVSTSSTTTTTISSANTTKEKIMAIAGNYSLFITLQNYAALYAGLAKCTPSLYNSTYLSHTSAYPSGPSSYYNVSRTAPHYMTYSIKYVNSTTYSLVFDTVSNATITTGASAIIYIDLPAGSVSGYRLEGAYSGQTDSGMQSSYANYTKIGGYCSILV